MNRTRVRWGTVRSHVRCPPTAAAPPLSQLAAGPANATRPTRLRRRCRRPRCRHPWPPAWSAAQSGRFVPPSGGLRRGVSRRQRASRRLRRRVVTITRPPRPNRITATAPTGMTSAPPVPGMEAAPAPRLPEGPRATHRMADSPTPARWPVARWALSSVQV